MRYIAFAAVIAAMFMLAGCGDSGVSSATTSATTASSAVEAAQDDPFFREMYAYELNNKYNQYVNDSEAFYQVYYVENAEDVDINAIVAAAEKCVSTLEAIITIEPTASLASYHEQVIESAEYEAKYYDSIRELILCETGEQELSAQEIEDLQAFLMEYSESETNLFVDAYIAAMEAAAGVV